MHIMHTPHLILVLVLVLLAGSLVFTVANQANAEGDDTSREETAVAAIGTTFTYQGSLENNGSPVNGTCDMQFSLYDTASSGSQAGSTVTQNSVAVSDGLFAVDLDFGSQFTGDARFLQIAVRCSAGSGSYTPLIGRVALNATPYALSLRPGANVQGSDTSNRILGAVNTATSGSGAGLYGEAQSSGGAGVSGWNTSSSSGYAIYGNNAANAGTPYGIYGIASDSGSATSYGVYGQSNSFAGTGVGGKSPTNGIYGEATNTTGTTWGIYGKSNSATGYGIYSSGNAHIDGQLTWKPMTSTISLAAAAFNPTSNGFVFSNDGHSLTPGNSASNSYLAPVQLPQGATVTKLTFYWTDDSNENGTASLYRIDLDRNENQMALTSSYGGSSGGGGGSSVTGSSNDTTVVLSDIDNTQYAYYAWLNLPTDINNATVHAHGVTIEYTINQPY